MFNIGLGEITVIFIVALLFWGPGSLPEIGRNLGKLTHKLRALTKEFKAGLGSASKEFDELRETVDTLRNPISSITSDVLSPSPAKPKGAHPLPYRSGSSDDYLGRTASEEKPEPTSPLIEPEDDYLGAGDE